MMKVTFSITFKKLHEEKGWLKISPSYLTPNN